MERAVFFFKHQVFHACVGAFLPGLTEKNHQHDPLNLFYIDIGCIQRQQAINQQFALWRRQNSDLLQVSDKTAATGIEPREFDVVLLRLYNRRWIGHVGLMVDGRRMLHTERASAAVVVPLNHYTVRDRIAGFRRFAA